MILDRSQVPQQFIDLFLNTIGLTDEEFELALKHFWREFIPKKFFYLKAGQICRQIAFLTKGCSRSFTTDEKGGEHILFFAFEDWIIGDMESIQTGKPGVLNIQAMEDCELMCIQKADMDKLENQLPKIKEWHIAKQQRALHVALRRLSEVKSLTPEERYNDLIIKYPQIFQRVPLQYIAMYLDIEPQSLSRLRKRICGK